MKKIYIIHENDEWTSPLEEELTKLNAPYEKWHMNLKLLDTNQYPPLGVFYNRMSASSHTRGHRYAPEYTSIILDWLEYHERKVVNGSRALNLEISKSLQYKELKTANNTLFTCFELFEHVLNPNTFLKKIYNLMKRNDIFVLTTLSGTGLDIISLGKKSNSISPPQHLNFFNPFSIELLLKKNHFKIVSVSTPGKLDISILENNRNYVKDEFIKNLLEQSPFIKNNFQKFISNNNLSSHMMVVCKK